MVRPVMVERVPKAVRRSAWTALLALALVTPGLPATAATTPLQSYSGTLKVEVRRSSPGNSLNIDFRYDAAGTLSLAFSGRGTGRWSQTPVRQTPLSGSYSTTATTGNVGLCSTSQPGSGALGGTVSYYLWPNVTAGQVAVDVGITDVTMTPSWQKVCGLPQDQGTPIRNAITAASSAAGTFVFPVGGGTITKTGSVPSCASAECTYTVTAVLRRTGGALPTTTTTTPVVPLSSVSNGCGGGEVGNAPRYLDEVTFTSGAKGPRYRVNFRQGCNVHDAGYFGARIRNPLHGNVIVDYRNVPRKTIDDQFRNDLKLLCDKQLPATATTARNSCHAHADAYWAAVRVAGWKFFDADPGKPGIQVIGPRSNK